MDYKRSWAITTWAPRYPAFMGLCAIRSCLVEWDKKIFINCWPVNLIKTNHFGCYNKYESVGRLSDKNQANVAIRPSVLYSIECWAIKKQNVHKISVVEMKMLR